MFGRIFGRGKDEPDEAVCAQCGRTLLVGEWTQNVVGSDGREYLICSLCGQNADFTGGGPVSVGTTPANDGRVRESRSEVQAPQDYEPEAAAPPPAVAPEAVPAAAAATGYAVAAEREPADERRDARSESDAFWRALKEKDAEIERLQTELARMDVEKQQLAGQLAAARAQLGGQATPVVVPAQPLVPGTDAASVPAEIVAVVVAETDATGRVDASEPGERTWGETPAEFAAELAALRGEEVALAAEASADEAVSEAQPASDDTGEAPPAVHPIVFETTQPIPALTDEMIADDAVAASVAEESGEAETTLTPETGSFPVEAAAFAAASAAQPAPATPQQPEPTAAELEAEAASLTLLQRGVDLLNVSRVPHKIAETSEQLGLPVVHAGFDGQLTVVTFMWTMGWYQFKVDADSGDVRMADRGYDERTDLRPNAGVRADGTVQLAPAQISRAAKSPAAYEAEAQAPAAAAAPAAAGPPAEPEPPSVAAQKAPEILSKSLLGQRSDDDVASWEQTQARDFDWNR